jgi:tetratricopeptide (TPR) repeat protein
LPAKPATKSKRKGDADYKPGPELQLALAKYQEQHGTPEGARKSYEQLLAADAKSIDAMVGLARLDQVGGRTADAEAGFQKAVRTDLQSGRALDALGVFYIDQKRLSEAVATLQRALAASPSDKTIRFHYGVALAKSGQADQATPYLVEAVGAAAAHYNLGLILHERGELAASEEQFLAAILGNPRLVQAQYWLNEVRREQDQLQLTGATGEVRQAGYSSAPSR